MKKYGRIIGLVLIGILAGERAHEMLHPHGELSGGPQVSQESAPTVRHPYDEPMDIRDLREPLQRRATPTSANTLRAPIGADSAYVLVARSSDLSLLLLLVLLSLPLFAGRQFRRVA